MTLPTNRAPGARGLQLPDGRRRLAVAPGRGTAGSGPRLPPGRCPTVPGREDVAAGPPGTPRAQPASSPGPRAELAPAGPPRTLGVARPSRRRSEGTCTPGPRPPKSRCSRVHPSRRRPRAGPPCLPGPAPAGSLLRSGSHLLTPTSFPPQKTSLQFPAQTLKLAFSTPCAPQLRVAE